MAALEPVFEKMQLDESDLKNVRSERYFQKLGSNLNGLLSASVTDIGDIVPTILSEAQFQSQYGVNWVECNGQNIEPSELSSETGLAFAPDLRGRFLEQVNIDSDGTNPNKVINTVEADANKSHSHLQLGGLGAPGNFMLSSVFIVTSIAPITKTPVNFIASTKAPTAGFSSSTGVEFRPDNIAFRYMIKINN